MNRVEDLWDLFLVSFDDKVLSRAEARSIRESIRSSRLPDRERAVLRSRIFDFVKLQSDNIAQEVLLTWLEEANKTLVKPIGDNNQHFSEVYFSPGDECLNAIKNRIISSFKTIDICIFTISDNRISDLLIDALKRKVKIRLLTDNDKLWDLGSDVEELCRAGVPIKIDSTSNHMHHKFALFDGKYLLTGSYNWTRSAAERNHENVMITTDKKAYKSFAKEFDRLWEEMEVYRH